MQPQNQPRINWITRDPINKCVIGLDRDGVINEDLGTYCWRKEDFMPIEGSIEAIATLRSRGYRIVIITDQGGIEQGFYTSEDVDNLHLHMLDLFGQAGCTSIDAIYYSASSRKEDPYAKPNTGMFRKCEKENKGIKFNQGYYVGDKMKDLKAAQRVGAKPVLVRTGYGIQTEQELQKFTYRDLKKITLVFDNLAQFVDTLG